MVRIKDLIIRNREKIGEIVRFGITGVVSTLTNYLAYYIFLEWFVPTLSFTLAYIVAMAINYSLTTSFTFKVKANTKNAVGFVISNAINCGFFTTFLILWLGRLEQFSPIQMYIICI